MNRPAITLAEPESAHRSGRNKVVLLMFLLTMVGLHGWLAWRVRHLIVRGYPDFTIFYSAGKIVDGGLAPDLYNDATQIAVQESFMPDPRLRVDRLPYNHPPFEALLFTFLSRLSYAHAFLAWGCFNLLILAVWPYLLRPHLPLLQSASLGCFFLGALAFFPIATALLQGQDTILILLLFTATFLSLRQEKEFTAGCWLGLGMFRFQLILPIVLVWLLGRRLRALGGWALVTTILVLISIWMVGWQSALNYPVYAGSFENILESKIAFSTLMPNLRGLVTLLFAAVLPGDFLRWLTIVLSLGVVYAAASAGKGSDKDAGTDLSFSLCLLAAILAGYHSFIHDMAILFLAIVLLLNYAWQNPMKGKWARIGWFGPVVIMFLGPLQMLLAWRYYLLSLLAPVLLFWFWNVRRELRGSLLRTPMGGAH